MLFYFCIMINCWIFKILMLFLYWTEHLSDILNSVMSWITLIDFQILGQHCIPGINSTCLWYILILCMTRLDLLIFDWGFLHLSWKRFAYDVTFLHCPCEVLVSGYVGLINQVGKFPLLVCSLKEFKIGVISSLIVW